MKPTFFMGGHYIIFHYILILSVVIADQLTKYAAVTLLKEGSAVFILKDMAQLTLVKNRGAAFGILKNKQKLLKSIIAPLILILIIYMAMLSTAASIMPGLSLAFITGGALGNFIDRVRLNYVVDFLSFNVKRFPVFNLADVFIFAGAVLYVICSYYEPGLII